MKAQYYYQVRVPSDQVGRWRERVDFEIKQFSGELAGSGRHADYAPDMPVLGDIVEGFIRQPFRVLFTWIPDWSPNIDAGHHVIRLDTCEQKEKIVKENGPLPRVGHRS